MSLLSQVRREAQSLPSRVVLYAQEKFGKTSLSCHAPRPIVLMTSGETGLLSLLEAGLVPPTDHFPEDFKSWPKLTQAVRELLNEAHEYRTLVLDTANGAERMCAEHICEEHFDGKWPNYASYGKGDVQAAVEWGKFLGLLDQLRTQRKMAVLFLQHARVKSFNNPSGKDWDQYRPESIDKLWALTHKWSDIILFGGFKVQVWDDKAKADAARYLQAQGTPAIVAGNRYGLPAEITAPPGAQNLWKAFASALQKAKARGKPADSPKGEAKLTAKDKPADPQPAPAPPAEDDGPKGDAYEGPAPAGGEMFPAGPADELGEFLGDPEAYRNRR